MMGYIGTFYARLANYLENQNVEVYKIIFPMHEFGFPAHQRIDYSGDMSEFRSFLSAEIHRLRIRHVFMVNHLQIPHRIALDLCADLRKQGSEIDSFVFELGYLRPHYVTLESNGVNHTSNLIQPAEFYHSLPEVHKFKKSDYKPGLRWRKLWKGITFIQHAFTNYKIVNCTHKLQPRPSYIWFAILGFFRKYQYSITECKIKAKLLDGEPFFLGVLQVATDSQLSLGSRFKSVEEFITELIKSFALFAPKEQRLFLKHHPRDRGYNNYSAHIQGLVKRYGLSGRVFYFHDYPMAKILSHPSCSGVVLINSTVGYQALFHSVPLKSLGIAAYNIEGLADQQPLDHFWIKPNGSDRPMFRRFYQHVLSTTQINGDFDGNFPFKETFIVSECLRNSVVPSKK